VWRQVSGVDPYASTDLAYTREDVFNRDFHSRLFARATWGSWTFMSWVAYAQGTGTGPIEGTGASSYVEPEYGFDATWTHRVADRGDLSLRGYAVVFDSRAVTVPDTIDTNNCLALLGVPSCADTLHYVNFRPFFEPVLKWDWQRDGTHVTTLGAQAFIDGSVIITGTTALGGPQHQSDPATVAPLPNAALYAQHIWRGSFGVLNAGLRGDLGYIASAVSPRLAFSRALGESEPSSSSSRRGFGPRPSPSAIWRFRTSSSPTRTSGLSTSTPRRSTSPSGSGSRTSSSRSSRPPGRG
jgi:hypothetical protein